MPLDIDAIRNCIASGDTDQAFDGLQLYFREHPGHNLANDLTLIQGRWSSYKRNFSLGLNPDPSTHNQVNYALTELLDRLARQQPAVPVPGPVRPIPEQPAALPKFVVIYDVADDAQFKTLSKHLNILVLTNKIRMYNVHDSRFTGEVMDAARRELADAAYVLALITVNLFGSADWFGLLEEERRAGRRIIPIRLEKVGGYEDTDLSRLRSLPTLNRTVSDFPNVDAAYADIVGEIRKLL